MEIKVKNQEINSNYAIYNADCVDVTKGLKAEYIDYTIFSPPFPELYTYSDDERDMGNSLTYEQFFDHFEYLVKELHRVTKKGRLITIHCTDIPIMKEKHGYIGLRDFPGDLIRIFQKHKFIYHSRHIIWKDPLIEATRTKALGLMHKQLIKDSAICRAGLPDYLITMRKSGENKVPISHGIGLQEYVGTSPPQIKGIKFCHETWQKYASPVWMDIRQSNTLQKTSARADKDEKHICPLQLDTIERALTLWSSPGELIYSPFGGIGSEGYVALKMNRRFISAELKTSYYEQMEKNLRNALIGNMKLNF